MSQYSTDAAGRLGKSLSIADQIDKTNDVHRYLAYVLSDGRPRELRFIGPMGAVSSWKWEPDNTVAEINAEIEKYLNEGRNAYITINPVHEGTGKQEAVSDKQITHRTFIPVDVDPVRESGTLASIEQRDGAREVAQKVVDWYEAEFPEHAEPLFGCSGSGFQILLPCDLVNDSEAGKIVKGLLKKLDQTFGTDKAKIDQVVSNASRIMRICGTTAFYSKGKSRAGFILSCPDEQSTGRVLSADDLQPFLVPKAQKPSKQVNGQASNGHTRVNAYIKPILEDIATAADGTKHQTLFAKTARIANYVAGAGLEGEKVEYQEQIKAALSSNPGTVADWKNAENTILDAWETGIQTPKQISDQSQSITQAESEPEYFPDALKPDVVWPNLPPRNDLERSEFVSLMFGGRVLYCEQNGAWLMYEGGRWIENRKLAYQLAKSLPRLLARIGADRSDSKDWYAAAAAASNIKAVNSVLQWMQTDFMIDIGDLDADPWLLNLENGTLDLKTGKLRPHDPGDMLSKQAPVKFDPEAECPLTRATLEMFQPDAAMRELILQFAGYSLTGVISDLALPIWYGPLANNGKSTISEALRCVLGPDYSMSLDVEFLIGNKRQASDEYHIAQLKGMRHVLFEEPDQNATLRPKTLKALVDNRSEMTGRHPHGRPFRFKPMYKCHVVTNHKPNVKATDNGTWRRLLLVPFDVTIDPGMDKKDFKQELVKEKSGILNMLIEACLRWQAQGQLAVPQSVKEATAELRVSSDAIGQYIAERCVTGSREYRVKAGILYRNYLEYMEVNSDLGDPHSANAFGRYIGERYKKSSDKSYIGIGLKQ